MGYRLVITDIKLNDATLIGEDDYTVTYSTEGIMPATCYDFNFDSGDINSELAAACYYQRAMIFETYGYTADWTIQPWKTKHNGTDNPLIHQPQLSYDFIYDELTTMIDDGSLPTIEFRAEIDVPHKVVYHIDEEFLNRHHGNIDSMVHHMITNFLKVDIKLSAI